MASDGVMARRGCRGVRHWPARRLRDSRKAANREARGSSSRAERGSSETEEGHRRQEGRDHLTGSRREGLVIGSLEHLDSCQLPC